MWPVGRQREVLQLVESGCSDREVARRTGVPRSTIGSWRREEARCSVGEPSWRPATPEGYCYLLGMYLGDGHIVAGGRSARIAISLDAAHPGIVAEVAGALGEAFPGSPVRHYRLPAARAVELRLSNASLPYAFPQCRAADERPTSIPATSSATSRLTSGRSSASTATVSESTGPCPTHATSRSPGASPWRASTRSSVRRPDRSRIAPRPNGGEEQAWGLSRALLGRWSWTSSGRR